MRHGWLLLAHSALLAGCGLAQSASSRATLPAVAHPVANPPSTSEPVPELAEAAQRAEVSLIERSLGLVRTGSFFRAEEPTRMWLWVSSAGDVAGIRGEQRFTGTSIATRRALFQQDASGEAVALYDCTARAHDIATCPRIGTDMDRITVSLPDGEIELVEVAEGMVPLEIELQLQRVLFGAPNDPAHIEIISVESGFRVPRHGEVAIPRASDPHATSERPDCNERVTYEASWAFDARERDAEVRVERTVSHGVTCCDVRHYDDSTPWMEPRCVAFDP